MSDKCKNCPFIFIGPPSPLEKLDRELKEKEVKKMPDRGYDMRHDTSSGCVSSSLEKQVGGNHYSQNWYSYLQSLPISKKQKEKLIELIQKAINETYDKAYDEGWESAMGDAGLL